MIETLIHEFFWLYCVSCSIGLDFGSELFLEHLLSFLLLKRCDTSGLNTTVCFLGICVGFMLYQCHKQMIFGAVFFWPSDFCSPDMDSDELNGNGLKQESGLPPPPPTLPSNVVPELEPVKKSTLLPMARRGSGTKGQKVPLLTNHFRVNFNKADSHFFHYSVCPLMSIITLFQFISIINDKWSMLLQYLLDKCMLLLL